MLRVDTPHGQIGPYMDCGIQGEEVGDYIELCNSGSIQFESTDGYTSDGTFCENCNDVHQEEEMRLDPNDHMLCEHCFNECYTYLSNGDVVSFDDAVEAGSYNTSTGRTRWDWIHIDEAVFCENLDEYWHEDCVTESEATYQWIPTHMIDEYPEHFPSYFEDEE